MASETTESSEMKTIAITGHSQGPKSTHVEANSTEFVVGKDASPLEYMFGSLAACINVIGHMVAKDHGFAIENLDVRVEGDIDAAKYRGEATEPRAGFQSIRVAVTLDADVDGATAETWLNDVAERCPVADNLKNASELAVDVETA